MVSFLKRNAFVGETFAVFRCNCAAVAEENVHALVFGEDGCSEAAFAGSEHHYTATVMLIVVHIYLRLKMQSLISVF